METHRKSNADVTWYDQRRWAFGLGVAALLLAYLVASLAVDTGSLLQYSLVILLVFFAFSRMVILLRRRRGQ